MAESATPALRALVEQYARYVTDWRRCVREERWDAARAIMRGCDELYRQIKEVAA